MDGKIIARCSACCKHEKGFWLMGKTYSANAGKLACNEGCGFMKSGRVKLEPKST